jgi:CelD/BcsL family acetyltransferase involved in cellulose biosynthesis
MPRTTTAQRGTFAVRLLERAEQFASIKQEWLELERQTEQPCFFQSYAWCGHVAEVMTRAYPGRYAPLVAYATVDGKPVALWPLSRQKQSGIWRLGPIDNPFGQFAGILAGDADAANQLVAATIDIVRKRRLADVLRFEFVLSGCVLEGALRGLGVTSRGETGAPVLDMRPWPTIEALKSSRNKKTMKNLRNARNRLTKAGEHDHRVETDATRVADIIAATLARRTSWLEEKGLTAPQFRSPAHEDVISGGASWGLDQQRIGFVLLCSGKAIAHQWGFVHQKRYYAFMSAVDPGAVHLSAGRLHLSFVIADAMQEGIDAIEMLTPASDYKMVWTDSVRILRDMAMPLSAAGWALDLAWHRTLRPVVKACFYALPASLRRRAAAVDAASSAHEHE